MYFLCIKYRKYLGIIMHTHFNENYYLIFKIDNVSSFANIVLGGNP